MDALTMRTGKHTGRYTCSVFSPSAMPDRDRRQPMTTVAALQLPIEPPMTPAADRILTAAGQSIATDEQGDLFEEPA